MAEEPIEHEGVIDHIDGEGIHVRIISRSACADCRSKKMCSISDVKEKIITVKHSDTGNYSHGDVVTIEMKKSLGMTAVLFGYILPFIVLITSLILLTKLTRSEAHAGLFTLGILGVYYFILFLLRKQLGKKFRFSIRR